MPHFIFKTVPRSGVYCLGFPELVERIHMLRECSHDGFGKDSYALKQAGMALTKAGNARMMGLCLLRVRGSVSFCWVRRLFFLMRVRERRLPGH